MEFSLVPAYFFLGHNVYLKQLLLNKHYAHGFDYWKTMRAHGPKPDTLSYNLYFALVEAAGSPYDIIGIILIIIFLFFILL